MREFAAEFIGTFILVFAITATIAGTLSISGTFGLLNLIAIALTAGLVLTCLAFTFGPISGGHFNPAVTIALAVANKFPAKNAAPYIAAQFLGGILASIALLAIAGPAQLGLTTAGSFGTSAALIVETIATMLFAIIILTVTSRKESAGHAPLAIGFYLLVAHLFAIPFSGASLNPARSLGPALLTGGAALSQVWIYFAGPIIGAIIGAMIFRHIIEK